MDLPILRLLTWATVITAVISALLLSGGDAALPDAEALPDALATEIENITEDAPAPNESAPADAPAR